MKKLIFAAMAVVMSVSSAFAGDVELYGFKNLKELNDVVIETANFEGVNGNGTMILFNNPGARYSGSWDFYNDKYLDGPRQLIEQIAPGADEGTTNYLYNSPEFKVSQKGEAGVLTVKYTSNSDIYSNTGSIIEANVDVKVPGYGGYNNANAGAYIAGVGSLIMDKFDVGAKATANILRTTTSNGYLNVAQALSAWGQIK